MSKAKSRTTPNRASRHRLLPGYRACDTLTFLSPAQIEALEELCVLSACTTGFSFSEAMDETCTRIAARVGPADRAAYLAHASKRKRLEIFRSPGIWQP
jgi:hypothetical protein